MFLLVIKWLLRGVSALALFPFVLLKNKKFRNDTVLINHERIHLRQQLELLVLPFHLWYLMESVVRLVQYCNHRQAYLNISFEREAYFNERDLNYLRERGFWKFRFYF
jgi:hypothetical protein